MFPEMMPVIPAVILAIENEEDSKWMEQLFTDYYKTMCRVAKSCTSSEHDANDAVGKAVVSLVENFEKIRSLPCNVLEGYIVSSVRNAATDIHRKACYRHETKWEEKYDALEAEDVETRVFEKYRIEEISKALKQLSPEDQMILTMRYYQAMTTREIAEQLDISESAARVRLLRARNRLAKILEDDEDEQ